MVLSAAHVQTGMLLLDLRQLFLDLCLDFTEDILDNPLTGFGIAARRAPPLPTAALTLADIALTLCPFFADTGAIHLGKCGSIAMSLRLRRL